MTDYRDSTATVAARAFWRTRQFWLMMGLIIASCILIGYLIGNWVAAGAKGVMAQRERAYNDASDARKVVLQQCLDTMEKQNQRLASLGDKAATAAAQAAEAANKVADDKSK